MFEGHPSWRALLSYDVPAVAGALVVAVIVALVSDVGLAVLVGAVLVAGVLLYGFIKRIATVYMVSSQRLYIRRGILSKRVQQTRIDRVQNVNTDQSLLNRILRVGNVDFDTAGTDDSDFHFVGIPGPTGCRGRRRRAARGRRAGQLLRGGRSRAARAAALHGRDPAPLVCGGRVPGGQLEGPAAVVALAGRQRVQLGRDRRPRRTGGGCASPARGRSRAACDVAVAAGLGDDARGGRRRQRRAPRRRAPRPPPRRGSAMAKSRS